MSLYTATPRYESPQRECQPTPGAAQVWSEASALEHLLGDAIHECAPAGISPFAVRRVHAGSPLIHEGSAARSLYLVQAGWFKLVHTSPDGYDQILDFCGRDELLGCDGLVDGRYRRGVVALEESWVFVLPTGSMQRLSQHDLGFNVRLQTAIAREIVRADEVAWLMAAVGAEKRLARFLMLYSRRMAQRGESAVRLQLRMSRRDIASHLGLAHESVSRALSVLAASGIVGVDKREILIRDREALDRFAQTTRGYPGTTRLRGDSDSLHSLFACSALSA